jgi:ADP-ribose pyrophosphatase YjhB (NUDIX family)
MAIRTSARAMICKNDALLVIRYEDAAGQWYALPGGGQRIGEGLEASLVREVAEETGLKVRIGRLRFVRECIATPSSRSLPADFHQVELIFECDAVHDAGAPSAVDPTQAGIEWLAVDELRRRCFFPIALLDALDEQREVGYLGIV